MYIIINNDCLERYIRVIEIKTSTILICILANSSALHILTYIRLKENDRDQNIVEHLEHNCRLFEIKKSKP